jgi:arylmalonate decarboxylase
MSMRKHLKIGLVVPFATDRIPAEGPMMYPDVTFIPRGVGVRALTPEGYDAAWDAILPAAKELAKHDIDAIMVIGTSLTFYRGYEAHRQLLEQLRAETGLPVSTMSEAVVEGLRSVGAKRVAVATAYSDLVNERLADFLARSGYEVLSMKGFGLTGFGDAANQSEQDIIDLSGKAIDEAKAADAVLISCGGLKTLGCAVPIEQRYGIPVVTSTQSAFWKALRLAGDTGHLPDRGQMLGQNSPVAA